MPRKGDKRAPPSLGNRVRQIRRKIRHSRRKHQPFLGSGDYWEERYITGGHSGIGSYRQFAEFKASILNQFVEQNNVRSVIEFGCGDGNQLLLAKYPDYIGIDVSATAIELCREAFPSGKHKRFKILSEYEGETADLALSLDVVYHLVEDDVFEDYMRTLFSAADRYVIIYSSNFESTDKDSASHVRHRKFSDWVSEYLSAWRLDRHIPNKYPYQGDYRKGSFSDFYIYEKSSETPGRHSQPGV